MKIAVIGSKGLPPRQGGIEHHCAEIYHRIAAKGHEVTVFARSSYINWLFNVPFFHKDVRISTLRSVPRLGFNSAFFYKDVQIASLPSVPLRGVDALVNSGLAATIASLRQFDIIHFHALGPAIFSWLPRLVNSKAKVVVTCHGIDWQRAKWGKLSTHLIKFGEKATVRYAHEIGVVSEDLGTYFQKKYNRQTTYISNAPSHYSQSDPAFPFGKSQELTPGRYLLFLGRLVPEKQPDLLIRAFQKLLPIDWKLVLVGGISDTWEYYMQLRRLTNLNPNILFMGELQGERLAEIVRGAGLFILPSKVEGLPLALLEAMQEGIPVLASDLPVHRQLLGSNRGVLFKEGNVDHCAQALDWAIQNPTLMKQMANRAQEYVQHHHNWDYIAENWLALYEKLLRVSSFVKTPISY